ncbi:MAG: FAD-dependent monooxygenase [Bryobacteraceae bacterium]
MLHAYNVCLTVDVAIVGSGPAGCALAMRLRKAGVSVATFTAAARSGCAGIPETLPAGVREKFLLPVSSNSLRPHYSMASAWGGPELTTRHSICNPLGHGWFVDRAVFDREMLAEVPAIQARITSVSWTPTGWALGFAGHTAVRSGVVVDASGRSSAFARLIGVRRLVLDRLVALSVRAVPVDFPAGEALVESAEAGWWFSAPTPEGELSVSWFGYQDRIPFAEALRATVHTSRHVGFLLSRRPVARAARTDWLEAPAGLGWLAAGDAAFASDPLGSQGLLRALEAADAAAKIILSGSAHNSASIREYCEYYRDYVKRFLRERHFFYGTERRWPHAPFWRAAHAGA